MVEPKQLARAAGCVYLLMAVLGGYTQLGVRAGIHVPGDAAASTQNLAGHPTLFRLALVADIAMVTTFVVLGVLLFLLLRHVDRHVAGALLVFVAVGAGLILTNLLLHQAALLVATDPAYTSLASEELVLLLLDLHQDGYTLAGVFFGLWLLPLSYLAYRSELFPRTLSVLLAVAGGAWILDTLAAFLVPDLPAAVHSVLSAPRFAEFWLIGYLLVKGVRAPAGRLRPAKVEPDASESPPRRLFATPSRGPHRDANHTMEKAVSTPDKAPTGLQNQRLPVQAQLAAAWTSFMFLYAYADILGLYMPGVIDDIQAGIVWEFDISQAWATGALTLMAIPILMVPLSVTLPARANRITNLAVAPVYVFISAGNAVGESWTYYFALVVGLEVIVLTLVLRLAWTWPRTTPPSMMDHDTDADRKSAPCERS